MRIRLSGSLAHFRPDLHPAHGPQVWPWWRLVSFGLVRLEVAKPSMGWRPWVYTRWGAGYGDLVLDRRKLAAA